ncbi:spermine/spermidine synthase domain-containing protein [Undibacterium flavidum]|uniref:Spermidine synthase n=1 Tax=Undibacterium flavidum TaxID=2762297 RepID=A0ABR6Y6L6_9BURK|nr:spermidine synthase [Undibacterium flavidum]MBC3872270.1 spermidine synthase [Undibacterium flavidum]
MMKKKNKLDVLINEHPDVFVSEFRGVRSLHLASTINSDTSCAPIQGSMRLAVPDQIELEYVQQMNLWMLFNMVPKHIVQLGLGAASLTKFCYRHFPNAVVTAVDLNPKVIAMCREQFKLPADDERLHVLEMDAFDFVRSPARHGKIDVIQVDLYDAEAEGPVLDSAEFYEACAACLTSEGMMTVNLFANDVQRQKNIEAMQAFFDVVVWLPEVHDANVVAIAFKAAPEIDFEILYQRAAILRVNYKLQAPVWVNGLKAWMLREDD